MVRQGIRQRANPTAMQRPGADVYVCNTLPLLCTVVSLRSVVAAPARTSGITAIQTDLLSMSAGRKHQHQRSLSNLGGSEAKARTPQLPGVLSVVRAGPAQKHCTSTALNKCLPPWPLEKPEPQLWSEAHCMTHSDHCQPAGRTPDRRGSMVIGRRASSMQPSRPATAATDAPPASRSVRPGLRGVSPAAVCQLLVAL